MNSIWLSVLIPTRNRLLLLRETIASVLSQNLVGVEIVVSDNFSTDGTREYLEGLAEKGIRVILRNGDGGFVENVNGLVDNSLGEYFILLHDDDMMTLDAISSVRSIIDHAPGEFSLLVGGYELLDEGNVGERAKTIFHDRYFSAEEAACFFSSKWEMRAPSIYYNRKYVRRPFCEKAFGSACDSKAILDFILSGPVLITCKILGVYRQGLFTATMSNIYKEEWGLSSLVFAQYSRIAVCEKRFSSVISKNLVATIYGAWLMIVLKHSIKRWCWGSALEYFSALCILRVFDRPISWRMRSRIKAVLIRRLSSGMGGIGRKLSLKLLTNIENPSLVSGTSQLIGLSQISIKAGTTVGQATTIIANRVENGTGVAIGAHGYIGKNVYISSGERIEIGSHVLIGAGVQILGAGHKMDPRMPIRSAEIESYGSIFIGCNVWIGNGAILIGNITIGDGSVIAAGSHVRNLNIPRFVLAAGNPAKIVRQYNFNTNKWEKLFNGCVDSDELRGVPATWDLIACDKLFTEINPDKISFSEESGYLY